MADVLYHGVPLDLYTVSKYMLGYDRMNDHHKEWCKTLAVVRKKHNRVLLLKPRATFKSTFYTVSSTIDYLIDDWVKHDGVFYNRTLIASATDEMAKQLLGEIVQHLRGNENVKSFFGYDPIKSSTQQELWLTPKKVHKEPTIKAKGALSSIVSEHYDRIIVDDLCFDDKTEILTDHGWKLFKDLTKEDKVATLNGENLEYHKPTRYIDYEYDGEMIGIKGDAINFLVTPDHKLYFKKAHSNDFNYFKLVKASEVYGCKGKFRKRFAFCEVDEDNWFKENYSGHVYCVDVPNHIIYVRRNGKGVWLGNCNNEDRESQAVREQKIRWFIDLISILEPDGELLVVGTRWHDADVYNYIMEMNEKLPERDKYHIEIEAICDENGNPNFNEIYSKDDIERLKIEKGLIEFYAQYMNQTLPSETQRFKPEHFRFYPDNGVDDRQFAGAAKFMYVDPALGRENDYSVALVGFVKPSNPEWLYVRNAFISNVTTPDQTIDEIARLVEMYDIPVVDVEANNFQTMFANAIRNRKVFVGTKKERKIAVREVRNRKKKELRIDSIEPFFTQHKVYFCEDWKQYYPELIDQLVRYPVHQHDDCPDAMEGLIRISLKGAASMREMIGMVGGKMRRTFIKNNRSRWR